MKKMIKIMHITYSLDVGGLEKLVFNIIKRLNKNIFNPCVCVLSSGLALKQELVDCGASVYVEKKRDGLDFSLIFRLARLFKSRDIDLVHTHNPCAWLYGGFAAKLANRKLIHTEHSNLFSEQKRLKAIERILSSLTPIIIADSKKVKDGLISEGIREEKIRVIYNGVNLNGAFRDKSLLKEEFDIEKDELVIGTVARLVPLKNIDLLIDVFSLVLKRYQNLRLLIIGAGPLLTYYKEKTKALKDKIIFLGERNDVQRLLNIFDIFVLPSLSEGMPLAILEAMSAGLPVIASNVGGVNEIINNKGVGVLFKSKNKQQLLNILERLIQDKELRRKLGEAAKNRIKEAFSIDKMVDSYEGVYESYR